MRGPLRSQARFPATLPPLAHALGVTRVARLTGLDRTGIEVASAIRPGAHVLHVTNGKGRTFGAALRGALHEAAELWAAERAPAGVPLATAEEIGAASPPGTLVLSPAELSGALLEPMRCGWCRARALDDGRPALVPFDAVHCPPAGGVALPAWSRWTSNGMGAGHERARALLHALLEAVERDQLARALPDGFTKREVARRLLDPAGLGSVAPRTAALRAELEGRGFRVHLLDLSPAPEGFSVRRAGGRHTADLGLPVAAAVVADEEGGPVPVAAGYACRLSRDEALEAALLEAVQSRATEIHGAREDVLWGDRAAAAPLAGMLAAVRPRRAARALPDHGVASPTAGAREVIRRLAAAGLDRGAAVELDAPGGVHVVKVIVPGLLLSELLC